MESLLRILLILEIFVHWVESSLASLSGEEWLSLRKESQVRQWIIGDIRQMQRHRKCESR